MSISVLVGLYEEPERPQNAVDYIKRYMGAPTGVDIDAIRLENEKLKKEKAELESQLKTLNSGKVSCYNIYMIFEFIAITRSFVMS